MSSEKPSGRKANLDEKRLWAIQETAPSSVAYNIIRCWEIRGSICTKTISSKINAFIKKSTSLHGYINNSTDTMTIHYDEEIPSSYFENIDFSSFPPVEAKEKALVFIRRKGKTPFNLKKPPLYRVLILQLSKEHFLISFIAHHIVFDGISLSLLTEEILSLKPYTPTASTFINNNKTFSEKDASFWKIYLRNLPQTLSIPEDKKRPTKNLYRGEMLSLSLDREQTLRLEKYAKRIKTTLPCLFLSTFSSTAMSLGGSEETIVALTINKRKSNKTTDSVGFHVNTLPIRVKYSENFQEMNKEIAADLYKIMRRRHTPLDWIINEIDIPKSLNTSSFMPLMFNYFESKDRQALLKEGTAVDVIDIDLSKSMFDISFIVEKHGEGIMCFFEYNTDIYRHKTIANMAIEISKQLDKFISNNDSERNTFAPHLFCLLENEKKQKGYFPVGKKCPDGWKKESNNLTELRWRACI